MGAAGPTEGGDQRAPQEGDCRAAAWPSNDPRVGPRWPSRSDCRLDVSPPRTDPPAPAPPGPPTPKRPAGSPRKKEVTGGGGPKKRARRLAQAARQLLPGSHARTRRATGGWTRGTADAGTGGAAGRGGVHRRRSRHAAPPPTLLFGGARGAWREAPEPLWRSKRRDALPLASDRQRVARPRPRLAAGGAPASAEEPIAGRVGAVNREAEGRRSRPPPPPPTIQVVVCRRMPHWERAGGDKDATKSYVGVRLEAAASRCGGKYRQLAGHGASHSGSGCASTDQIRWRGAHPRSRSPSPWGHAALMRAAAPDFSFFVLLCTHIAVHSEHRLRCGADPVLPPTSLVQYSPIS